MTTRGTPATVLLARQGIPHSVRSYQHDPRSGSYGLEASEALGVAPDRVFKTLVAEVDGVLAVGVVPVAGQLDLKALAAAAGGKRAAMAAVADAERATGYVAGGISPLGHRRRLPVVIDSSALGFPTIFCSGGRRGLEIELAPADLIRLADAVVAPIAQPAPARPGQPAPAGPGQPASARPGQAGARGRVRPGGALGR